MDLQPGATRAGLGGVQNWGDLLDMPTMPFTGARIWYDGSSMAYGLKPDPNSDQRAMSQLAKATVSFPLSNATLSDTTWTNAWVISIHDPFNRSISETLAITVPDTFIDRGMLIRVNPRLTKNGARILVTSNPKRNAYRYGSA